MALFLERYHARGNGGEDLAELLSNLQMDERDGLPLDPATWTDWLEAVEEAIERQPLPAAE